MLKDNFFKVLTIEVDGNSITAVLELDAGHNIFKGHFPGAPVVPGVCMMQMVKEILEFHVGETLLLSDAVLMKFLSVIDPRMNYTVKMNLSYEMIDGGLNVDSNLSAGETVCFKFKGKFVFI